MITCGMISGLFVDPRHPFPIRFPAPARSDLASGADGPPIRKVSVPIRQWSPVRN
jgi:hypothetical protein